MKKIVLAAVATSALMLAGCGSKEEAAPAADATPAAEASAAGSDAPASDAGTATDAAATPTKGPNKGTSGGPNG